MHIISKKAVDQTIYNAMVKATKGAFTHRQYINDRDYFKGVLNTLLALELINKERYTMLLNGFTYFYFMPKTIAIVEAEK